MTSSLANFDLACLLICAVNANTMHDTPAAMWYLDQIPTDQLQHAELMLSSMRAHLYLRRQSEPLVMAMLTPDDPRLPGGGP